MLALATAILWVATNIYIVVASRVVQGFSYAVIFTVGLALLVDTVDHTEVGQFLGYFSSSANVALLSSPLFGGVVYSQVGYHAVFAILFALVMVDFSMRLVLIEKKDVAKWEFPAQHDVYGTFQDNRTQDPHSTRPCRPRSHSGSTSSLLTSSTSDQHSNTASGNRVSLDDPPGGVARVSQNLPVLLLLKSPRFLAATYGIFLNYSLIASFDSVLPIFVERTFGWDPYGAGLIFLCIVLPTLAAPLVGTLSDKYGARWFAASGLILTTPFLILLRLVTDGSLEHIVLLCVLLTLIGMLPFPIQASISGERCF